MFLAGSIGSVSQGKKNPQFPYIAKSSSLPSYRHSLDSSPTANDGDDEDDAEYRMYGIGKEHRGFELNTSE